LPADDLEEDSLTGREVNNLRDQEQKKKARKESNVYSYLVILQIE
jgi:hypothetical protein